MEELQLPSLRVNIKQNNFTTILKYVRNPDSDKTKQGGEGIFFSTDHIFVMNNRDHARKYDGRNIYYQM